MPPKDIFVKLDKLHKCMKKKFILGNCYLNNLKHFWLIWPRWPWPLTPKSIGFLCCPGWMCGPCLRKLGQGVLELLIGNSFGTFDPGDLDLYPSDPQIIRVPLLPRSDVWTKFEEGRSGVLELLVRNEKVTDGQTDRPTDRQTDGPTERHVQSNMPSLLQT